MEKMFFTVDDLAMRWGVPPSQIGELGAEGLMQFGVYLDGDLFVEIGHYGATPEFLFEVESTAVLSGFVPVTSDTAASCWLRGFTDNIAVPNTDCGKTVRVVNYIPRDANVDSGLRLMVSAAALEKYEKMNRPDVINTAPTTCVKAPDKWSRGMKLVAWDVAHGLVNGGHTLSGPALWEGMAKDDRVKPSGNTLRFKVADAKLKTGEAEVKESTIKKDWFGQLKKLLTRTA